MASACINHIQPTTYSSSYTWLNNPTISINHEEKETKILNSSSSDVDSNFDSSSTNAGDFNFQLGNDNVTMLPADELFSDGKLLPLQFTMPKSTLDSSQFFDAKILPQKEVESLQDNPHLFSPKAPRCSSRLKELLGFKKTTNHCKLIKQLLYKNNPSSSKTTSSSSHVDASLSSPLLSSLSSSSADYDDHPRLSLDSEKPNNRPIKPISAGPKLRPVRPKPTTTTTTTMMESPRMNPSGRVVFEGLERSTSCPSSFNGGLKYKHYKGSLMERSYSANVNANNNVRITPVLNVPVCSIRGSSKLGFGHLFSAHSQKKEGINYNSNCKTHHHNTGIKKKEKHKENS